MKQKDLVKIVVAGDVDAGKSTLIGRLLFETGSLPLGVMEEIEEVSKKLGRECEFAYLLDSLEEERRDERTIDTTQVFARTRDKREFVFIDVPGHRELLKNMISGSSYADMAVLIIDVQKSIVEQTRRHAFILQLLGMKRIVLVFNKMDTVGYRESAFAPLRAQAEEFLKAIGVSAHCYIPVAAKAGQNLSERSELMKWYTGPKVIQTFAVANAGKKNGSEGFVFCIQDIYHFERTPWAAGYIVSGKVRQSEKVLILPIEKEFRVKALRSFLTRRFSARAPESIGISGVSMDLLQRGQLLCGRDTALQVAREYAAKIFCARPLSMADTFSLRCLTQETSVRIKEVCAVWDTSDCRLKERPGALKENDIAQVVLSGDKPIALDRRGGQESLGRFVLQGKDKEIYAMGMFV